MDIWLISLILVATLWVLISEKISIDLTAIGIIVLLVVFGLLSPREAVSGFANPAVITVAAMFVVSRGLIVISTAVGIGVCFGASSCFASPLGCQTNLMVFVPGGYSFMGYFRLGIPLNIFVVVAGMLLIPLVWPF